MRRDDGTRRGDLRILLGQMRGERLRYGAALLALLPAAAFLYLVPLVPPDGGKR